MTRRSASGFPFVVLAVVLAACGGGSGSTTGDTAVTQPEETTTTAATGDTGATVPPTDVTTAPTEPPTVATTAKANNRQKVGDVTAVLPSGGTVDAIDAVQGSPLFAGSTIAAAGGGQLDFRVGKKLPSCRARIGGSTTRRPAATCSSSSWPVM